MKAKIMKTTRGWGVETDQKIKDKNPLVAGGGVRVEKTAGHGTETEEETYRG